jgi:hypothetical protein
MLVLDRLGVTGFITTEEGKLDTPTWCILWVRPWESGTGREEGRGKERTEEAILPHPTQDLSKWKKLSMCLRSNILCPHRHQLVPAVKQNSHLRFQSPSSLRILHLPWVKPFPSFIHPLAVGLSHENLILSVNFNISQQSKNVKVKDVLVFN